MAATNLLTILHISDFHFSKKKQREQTIIVDALIADLEKLCIGHRKPDLVLFTGDLVQAAGLDTHDEAYDVILDRVSKASGCSDERIFIVPGNHDVSWSGLEGFSAQHQDWRGCLGTPNEMSDLNELFTRNEFDSSNEAKFKQFNDLDKYIRSSSPVGSRAMKNSFASVDYIDALGIDLVTLNSAVFSTGGHKSFERDERRLAIPEYALLDAIRFLRKDALKYFLFIIRFLCLASKMRATLNPRSRSTRIFSFSDTCMILSQRVLSLCQAK